MGRESLDGSIEFRACALKEAATTHNEVLQAGLDIGKVARDGLSEMLRHSLADYDQIAIVERYLEGDFSEDGAGVPHLRP